MKLFVLALVAALLPAQIRQPAANIRFGSSLPSTCTANIGQVFFLTSASAGANLYGCTATNTWTVQGSGVGGASNLTTVGAVPYVSASGVLNQDASNFFWDATNHRLGIGTNAPAQPLDILGNTNGIVTANIKNSSAGTSAQTRIQVNADATSDFVLATYSSGNTVSAFGVTLANWSAFFSEGANSNGLIVGTATAKPLRFATNVTTQGIITSGGSWGIGTSNTSPTSTLSVLDRTAGSGATSLLVGSDGTNTSATTTQVVVKAGTAQSTTDLQQWQNNAGTVLARVDSSGNLISTGSLYAGTTQALIYGSRSAINSPADGVLQIINQTGTDFNRLQFGGTTSSFPALKRSGTTLAVRLADDSADAPLSAAAITSSADIGAGGASVIFWSSSTRLSASANGNLLLRNAALTDFDRLQLGGTTSSFPSIKRSTTGLIARLADDSADTWVQASQFRSTLTTPASAVATCTAGTIVADTGFVYVCTAADTWKRVAIATW